MSHGNDVTGEQFEHFGEALIETLREFSKEEASVLEAWERVMRPGLEYLKKHCSRAE